MYVREVVFMVQHIELSNVHESISQLSNPELRDVIAACEASISEGSARIEDYEAFVLAQQELARRLWL